MQQQEQQQQDTKHISSVFLLICRKHLFLFAIRLCVVSFIEIYDLHLHLGLRSWWWNTTKVQKELGIYRQALRACELAALGFPNSRDDFFTDGNGSGTGTVGFQGFGALKKNRCLGRFNSFGEIFPSKKRKETQQTKNYQVQNTTISGWGFVWWDAGVRCAGPFQKD